MAGHILHGHAHVGVAGDLPVLHDVLEHVQHVVNGDGEAQSLGGGAPAVGGGGLGGDNAHHLAVAVKEGAAGVAGVDGRVHLDHVKGGAVEVDLPVEAGDDAPAHGEGQLPQGVADGGHVLPYGELIRGAQHHGLEGRVARVHLQHGDVVVRVAAHHLGGVGFAVIEGDLHVRGAADYVGVGGDIAVGGEDKAAAGAGGLHWLAEEVVARQGGGVDAHAAVHVGVVELGEAEPLAAGDADGLHLHRLPVATHHLGLVRLGVPPALHGPSRAKGPADEQRPAENAGQNPLAPAPPGLLQLHGGLGGLEALAVAPVIVVVLVSASVVIVIHKDIPPCQIAFVCLRLGLTVHSLLWIYVQSMKKIRKDFEQSGNGL